MSTKDLVIEELKELNAIMPLKKGLIEAVESGDFDEDIDDSEGMKISELSNMIVELYSLKS